jgi:putative transposase
MPNHFHFVASPSSDFWEKRLPDLDLEGSFPNRPILHQRLYAVIREQMTVNEFLELQFKDFFGSYSKSINKQEKRTGSLFQQRFKRVKMKSIAQIAEKICYTHHNPIHHGFCKAYTDWQYSSYHAFLCDSPTRINRNVVFEFFNETVTEAYVTDTFEEYVTDISKVSVTWCSVTNFIKVHEEYRNRPKNEEGYDIEDL